MRTEKKERQTVAIDSRLHALVKEVCMIQDVPIVDFTSNALKYYMSHAITLKGRGKVFNAKNASKQVSKVNLTFEIPEGQLTELIMALFEVLPHYDISEDSDE